MPFLKTAIRVTTTTGHVRLQIPAVVHFPLNRETSAGGVRNMEDVLMIAFLASPAVLVSGFLNWRFSNYALACLVATPLSCFLAFCLTGFGGEGYVKLAMIIMVTPIVFLSGIPFAAWRTKSKDWISHSCWASLAAGWIYLLIYFLHTGGNDLLFGIKFGITCLIASVLVSFRMAFLRWRTSAIEAGVNMKLPRFLQ